jgi:hypothetical protein
VLVATNNFSYAIASNTSAATDFAKIGASPVDVAAKGYNAGMVRYVNSASNSTTASIICESNATNAQGTLTANMVQTAAGADLPTTGLVTCATGWTNIQSR